MVEELFELVKRGERLLLKLGPALLDFGNHRVNCRASHFLDIVGYGQALNGWLNGPTRKGAAQVQGDQLQTVRLLANAIGRGVRQATPAASESLGRISWAGKWQTGQGFALFRPALSLGHRRTDITAAFGRCGAPLCGGPLRPGPFCDGGGSALTYGIAAL